MIEVYNLEEIPSSIPPSDENPRKFHLIKDPMFVNLDRVDFARAFKGIIVLNDDGPITPLEVKENLVEIFYSGNSVVTIFTSRVGNFLCPDEDDVDFKNGKIEDNGKELPLNKRRIPIAKPYEKENKEAWN